MPTYQTDSLPPIRFISFDSAPQQLPEPPQDLRVLRVEEFLKARSLSTNSQRAYRRELTRFLQWTDQPLKDITPRQIAQFKFHLVNRALATLKSFFSWLMKAYPELRQHNPTEPVMLEKLPLPPARDLSPEEVAALVEALEYRGESQSRDRALLAVLSHGLRASEVLGLNVGDYDGVRLTYMLEL